MRFEVGFMDLQNIFGLFRLSWRGSPREATGLIRNGLPQLNNTNKILP